MNVKATFGALFLFAFSASFTQAATLYMDPNTIDIERGDTIKVSIRLDTDEDECVNVVDATINYSDQVKLVDVSRGASILSMWVEDPKIDDANKTLTFAGGIPNGYCGRIAGDPRLTNVVADLIFQSPGFVIGAEENATATVSFAPETQVLLNDGFGTRAETNLFGASMVLHKNKGGVRDDWGEVVDNDFLPPERFSISLERSDNAFQNKYFITFNTTDKQSGIDHYEVIEEPLSELGMFNWGREDAPWVTAVSPYKLKDQTLNSTIRVRAIDKAGNEYIATLIPEDSQRTMSSEVKVLVAVVATVLFAFIFSGALYAFLRYRKKRKQEREEEWEEYEEEEVGEEVEE